MRRYAAKTDSNQKEIVDALRERGAVVFVIHQPFDLLVASMGRLHIMEVKNPEGRDKLEKSQKEDMSKLWLAGVRVHVVRSVDEALEALNLAL